MDDFQARLVITAAARAHAELCAEAEGSEDLLQGAMKTHAANALARLVVKLHEVLDEVAAR
jgi:hypothetical protein